MKTAGWLVANSIQACFTLLWTLIWVPAALIVLMLTMNRKIPLLMARRIWSAGLLWGARARLDIRGLENVDFSKPHVFVSNHQSMIDIPVVFNALPVNLHFIIKKELKYVPLIGWYAWAMGMIFVDRRNQSRVVNTLIRQTRDLLLEGRSVIAFPEGTRSRGRGIGSFKKGVFVAAAEAGVSVVPIAIEGAENVLPSDAFGVRPGVIRVSIGRPVSTTKLSSDERDRLGETMRQHVIGLHAGIKFPAPLHQMH